MAETTYRDVVVRLALKQAEAKVKVPDTGPAKKSVESWGKAIEHANEKMEASYEAVEEKIRDVNKSLEDAARTKKETTVAAIETTRAIGQVGTAMAQVGRAATSAARSFIFLSGASKENTEKMMRWIIIGEGLIQATTSIFQVTKAIASARKALAVATETLTLAEIALQVAMGPVGWAIAGITATIAAAGAAYLWLAEDAEESADRQIRASRRVKSASRVSERSRVMAGQIAEHRIRQELGRVSPQEEQAWRTALVKRFRTRQIRGELEEDEAEVLPRGIVESAEIDLRHYSRMEEYFGQNEEDHKQSIEPC